MLNKAAVNTVADESLVVEYMSRDIFVVENNRCASKDRWKRGGSEKAWYT